MFLKLQDVMPVLDLELDRSCRRELLSCKEKVEVGQPGVC
jgi:hypothetical protein